jgi:phosphoribosylformylglycinamidine cyclo-ligase
VTERAPAYRAAGVDLAAADQAVDRIGGHASRATRPEVLTGAGGFAGLFALPPGRWREPVLVTSCDGVGTKSELARRAGRDRGIGVDVVAMVVDDLVAAGAEPVTFCDYLAVEHLERARVEALVAGVADGCAEAGCALVGGETAEHPGVMPIGGYDLAGFGVGVVERDRLLGPERVRPGDELVALASSGVHANGFSLVRRIVDGLDLGDSHGLADGSLADALLAPTRIYAPACLGLIEAVEVHALCHVTGGGIPGNLPRVLPDRLGATIDAATFDPQPVFGWLAERGELETGEMWQVFNMGAGMLAVIPHGAAAARHLTEAGVPAWVCGRVDETGEVRIAGVDAGS